MGATTGAATVLRGAFAGATFIGWGCIDVVAGADAIPPTILDVI